MVNKKIDLISDTMGPFFKNQRNNIINFSLLVDLNQSKFPEKALVLWITWIQAF
jgi:hypothetical protein